MMVVAIHTFSIAETDIQHDILDVNALVRNVLNCAVPIFLAISGYFLCSKKLDTWADRRAFWRKQMPKVYVPTIIVSLPYLALALRHGSNPLTAVAMMLVCGFNIYYFIALILQYYALLPVFKKTNMGGGNFRRINIHCLHSYSNLHYSDTRSRPTPHSLCRTISRVVRVFRHGQLPTEMRKNVFATPAHSHGNRGTCIGIC